MNTYVPPFRSYRRNAVSVWVPKVLRCGQRRTVAIFVCVVAFVLLFSACSIQQLVMDQLSDALTGTGSSTVFLGDDDPQIVADALPFAIKLYESLMSLNPGHEGLLVTTGSLYIMYANAFIQLPAAMLGVEEFDKQQADLQRARKLYLRGRDIVSSAIDLTYPGFTAALTTGGEALDPYLADFVPEDVRLLYWLSSGWFAPVAIDSFDLEILIRLPDVLRVLNRAYELDPDFNNGTFEELFISVYSALPVAMGGGPERSIEAFERAVAIQGGSSASPYVALAMSVARPRQDVDWFVELLETALAVDADAYPQNRLINTIMQERARWLLAHLDNFFIL